jgi:hypothetical protein
MLKRAKYFSLALLLISCGKTINPEVLLKNENVFKLTVHTSNERDFTYNSEIDTIYKDSEKISKLKTWLIDNSTNWENSIASYAMPDISLIGTDFRLLIYKEGVVLGFTDPSGKQKQYTKATNKSTLNFLIDK